MHTAFVNDINCKSRAFILSTFVTAPVQISFAWQNLAPKQHIIMDRTHRSTVYYSNLKKMWKEILNLGNIDCVVRLDVLTDEQIAHLCRPNRIGKPPRNKRLNLLQNEPTGQIAQQSQNEIADDHQMAMNADSTNIVVPQPAAFIEIETGEDDLRAQQIKDEHNYSKRR
ncbi:uncharacterized protein LOC116347740 [Contarinia nasturtii]|uniref:uncharacterized protein LOC116347740 n=1 Tax=Contarinia nasturtii TaxID=265458 RepID=UPI0012D428E5|nr:uncharacterized protein LOC116347740 [Contarinia nasturtii]